MRQVRWRSAALAFVLCFVASPIAAEELVLQDGRKINGTIVGYENGMFRVETEFGFALVRKDKVASINVSAGGPKEKVEQRGERKDRMLSTAPASRPAEKPSISSESETSARAITTEPPAPAPQPAPPKPPAPPPPSHPIDEPLPARLQDHVEGSNYINDTFQFAMFKPLGWKIYEGAAKEAGFGIMAMGTDDERTLLIVDRQVWSGPPDLKNDRAEERLRQNYREFQKVSEARTQLDGYPANRRVFTTVIDGVEWHGVTVHLARGNTMFGIIGLTSAEMLGFQQAVLNKIINSFHFLAPMPATSGAARSASP